jgi:ribosomal protein S26
MQPTAFLCVICVICGRITRKRTQAIYKQGNPNISPADLTDDADKTQTTKPQNYKTTITPTTPPTQTVFLCEIMQPAAFLCVICAICGRITRKRTQSIRTNETPMSLADLADLRRRNPKTTLTTICLSLRNNAALLHFSATSALSAGEQIVLDMQMKKIYLHVILVRDVLKLCLDEILQCLHYR